MADLSLATRTLRGVFWTGSAFVLQILTTVVFYSYVPTAEMGQFEWALVVVMFLALLCDLGLGSALVQDREVDDACFDAALWTSLVGGLAVTGAVLVFATPLADLLSHEGSAAAFEPILSGLVLLVPFASVSGVFRSRVQRDLRWRAMALAEILSSVVHASCAFALIFTGHGVTGIVYSAVVREAALLAGLAAVARWRPACSFRLDALRRIARFGLELTGSRCLSYASSNLASLFIYPLLGEAAMGYFRLASRLTLVPQVRISTVITRVFFPTFAAVQDDAALLRRAFMRSVQALAFAYWPAMAVLFVLAPQVVAVTGQEGMDAALWPLRLLALATLLKAVGTPVGSIFLARGRSDWALGWSVFSMAVTAPGLWVAVDWGVCGVSAVVAGTSGLFLVLSQGLANRLLPATFAEYGAALWQPLLVTAVVGAGLAVATPLLPAAPLAACAAGGALSLALFAAATRLFAWRDAIAMWRSARGGGAAA